MDLYLILSSQLPWQASATEQTTNENRSVFSAYESKSKYEMLTVHTEDFPRKFSSRRLLVVEADHRDLCVSLCIAFWKNDPCQANLGTERSKTTCWTAMGLNRSPRSTLTVRDSPKAMICIRKAVKNEVGRQGRYHDLSEYVQVLRSMIHALLPLMR